MESPVLARYMRKTAKTNSSRNSIHLPTIEAKNPNKSQLNDMMSTNYLESEPDLTELKSLNATRTKQTDYYWRDFSQRSKKKSTARLYDSQIDDSLHARLGFSNRSASHSKEPGLTKEEMVEQEAEMAWVSGVEEWIKIHSGGRP